MLIGTIQLLQVSLLNTKLDDLTYINLRAHCDHWYWMFVWLFHSDIEY
jgi:hypothetical protein